MIFFFLIKNKRKITCEQLKIEFKLEFVSFEIEFLIFQIILYFQAIIVLVLLFINIYIVCRYVSHKVNDKISYWNEIFGLSKDISLKLNQISDFISKKERYLCLFF